MTAKQWLMRAWRIDREILSLVRAKERTRARVLSMTQSYSGNAVSGTKDPHKHDKLAVLEDAIDRRIEELVDIKAEVFNVIMQVQDSRYRRILMDRYIGNESWDQIAYNERYDKRHVCRLHGEALRAVEQFLPDYVRKCH